MNFRIISAWLLCVLVLFPAGAQVGNDYDGDGYTDDEETGALLADADLSGRVDGLDLAWMGREWGTSNLDPEFVRDLDYNRDGMIDGDDLAILAAYFSKDATATPTATDAIVIDHTAVALYDDIPQLYLDRVKAMRFNILGESHSMAYLEGLNLLEEADSRFDVVVSEAGVADPSVQALRADRARRSVDNYWNAGAGEEEWYTNETGRGLITYHLDWSNDNGYEIDAVGFGWCYDMNYSLGGDVDPVYGVRWAGSSVDGPDGNRRWGLDAEDTALTGNSIHMGTYLASTSDFQNHALQRGDGTVVFFTTGPVDGSANAGEDGYQRYLKHATIRTYVIANEMVLFDYADILTHNDAGEIQTTTWDGHVYPVIHPDNMLDLDGTYSDDIGHIGERGALKLGKALWVLLAQIAGWDPGE